MSKFESVINKILPSVNKFSSAKPVVALKNGILMVLPLSLIGSIFLLLAVLPIPGWGNLMANIFGEGWQGPLFQVVGSTFDIMALGALFAIAYNYVEAEGFNGVTAGILALVSYFILTPSSVTTQGGEVITGVVSKGWTGGKGMIAAIIIGLVVGFIYSWFLKRKITIKLPDSVPSAVANVFIALIPGVVITIVSLITYIVFESVTGGTFIEWIYKILQIPLQGLTDSLGGAIVIALLISLLWWFGIHGIAVVMGVVEPLLLANAMANQDIINGGGVLAVSQGAHIVTKQFVDQFIILGGSGMTLGLVLGMVLFAKSQRAKSLGKLSLVPALFNINEPIVFGFPIVFNPLMVVPFILIPVLSATITYVSINIGLVEPFTAITLPWSTPGIFSGFIVAGWKGALLQVVLIIMSAVIYLPFLKAQDNIYLKEEAAEEAAEVLKVNQ